MEANEHTLSARFKKKAIIATIALTTILSLWYDGEVTGSVLESIKGTRNMYGRALSLNLGDGDCQWVAAIQFTDKGFPSNQQFTKTIIAGYPSGDKRLIYLQLEALTGLSARDEWDFLMLGMTNQPFIKANYPHHEGIWGWGDVGDQVVMVVSDIKRVLIEYHDILWDIGYAQTFAEAYERSANLYNEHADGEVENPPVEDFLIWRDLRVFDEIHWYSWFIEYYMESGMMRDMFNHELTLETQWQMAMLPNFFTKFEMRHGRFVEDNTTITPSYDPMCATLSKGCYPVQIIDPEKLMDKVDGAAEARKLALVVNGTVGFDDWMIEEEAWACIWEELVIHRKGIPTFQDRDIDYESYTYSFELKNEMYHQINRLIEKFEGGVDQVSIDLIDILKGHRAGLGVTADTAADPLTYEELMSYHLAFPPFFPNQKMFKSDDDFYVRVHEPYADLDLSDVESIIDKRRAWFEVEMERKRERKIDIKYFDAGGWTRLPSEGLSGLTPYSIDSTTKIEFVNGNGDFAGSGRADNVAALFSGYLHIDPNVNRMCLVSDDGSKLFLDDELIVNNDGLHGAVRRCGAVSWGVYKIDVEFFEAGGGAHLVLEWGGEDGNLRVVPPRAWASSDATARFRELMRLNDILEEDLRTLKETDLMGPTTRREYNRRKEAANANIDPVERQQRALKKHDFSKLDNILFQRRLDQLRMGKRQQGMSESGV